MFDIYFENATGLEFHSSLFEFWISSGVIYFLIAAAVALRVRKVLRDKKNKK